MAETAEITKYVCLFYHRDHATAALKDLEAAGVPRADTTVIANGDSTYGEGYEYNAADDLANFGVPAKDLKHLQDEVRDGGVVLIVEGVLSQQKAVENIFHKHAAAKIDEADVETADDDTDDYDDVALLDAVDENDMVVMSTPGVIPVRVFGRTPGTSTYERIETTSGSTDLVEDDIEPNEATSTTRQGY